MNSHYAKNLLVPFNKTLSLQVATIVIFAAITALTARITILLPFTPVPITLQTLAVVLSGLVLGSRHGALAQLTYLSLIAAGLPFDAQGLGPAAFLGPTGGYLIGFVPAAFAAGWLAERRAGKRGWGNFAAAMAGMLLIYLVGVSWLALMLGSWQKAWLGGAAPFILIDLAKAATAAGAAESGKLLFKQMR
ncbi:MAG: biotin transporter BioY [Anaerolineae bacterium]|nr:biotin transporter BioY [Anaerolineae bacterium]